jgi:peptidoglycan/LPS O-acetylase OafA/YrhL
MRYYMNEYWDEQLTRIGFNITAALAGFFGGLLALLFDPRNRGPWHSAANVAAGVIAAGSSTDLVTTLSGLGPKYAGGIGFAIGLFGMAIVDKVIDYIAENKLDKIVDIFNPFRKFFNNKNKDK